MHKVHMHAGAIRQLLYGCVYVREILHSLKLVDYLPIHTHKPYDNLHLFHMHKAILYGLRIYQFREEDNFSICLHPCISFLFFSSEDYGKTAPLRGLDRVLAAYI